MFKSKEELVESPVYWTTKIKDELYYCLKDYMEKNNLNQTQLAEKLGVTRGYISHVLNGNFNFSLKKMVELLIAINRVPNFNFTLLNEHKKTLRVKSAMQEVVEEDVFTLFEVGKPVVLNSVVNGVPIIYEGVNLYSSMKLSIQEPNSLCFE